VTGPASHRLSCPLHREVPASKEGLDALPVSVPARGLRFAHTCSAVAEADVAFLANDVANSMNRRCSLVTMKASARRGALVVLIQDPPGRYVVWTY
jgi:hypothetical protein